MQQVENHLRILIVEDRNDDAELLRLELERQGFPADCKVVDNREAVRKALSDQAWDLVLTDHALPGFDSATVLQLLQSCAPDTPCIIVSGTIGEEAAALAFRHGALDYVNKEHLTRLGPAVERALTITAERRARRQAEEALRQQEELYRLVAQNSSDVVSLVRSDGTILFVSPSVERTLGYTPEDVLNTDIRRVVHPADLPSIETSLTGVDSILTHRVRDKYGSCIWMETSTSPVRDEKGQILHYLMSSRDVTARKRFEEQLSFQAFHDPLTSLPNRALFLSRLEHVLAKAKRTGERIAVLFVDLDNFKWVNDSLGHDAGDRLLIEVARRLTDCLRDSDTVSRHGGDEFTILLEDVGEVSTVTQTAVRIAEALKEPSIVTGLEVVVTASIGIVYHADGRAKPEDLLRQADVAMYRAKSSGKAQYAFYEPSLNDQALRRLELDIEVRHAAAGDQFILYFQPIIDIQHGWITAVEALIRWQHPTKGLLAPSEFIHQVEETQLIEIIGEWVMKRACQEALRCQQSSVSPRPISINVNFAVRQFRSPTFVDDLVRLWCGAGLDPHCFTLEITEGALIGDQAEAARKLSQLRQYGFGIEIDDFGTGYSSLAYLQHLPVTGLKLDRSFIAAVADNPKDQVIANTVVNLSKAMGLTVTAEGVETAAQWAVVKETQFDRAQGYYFRRPKPGPKVCELLKADRRW